MTRLILTSAMCIALMAATPAAFAPSASFVAPRHTLPAVYIPGASLTSSRVRSSNTAMQMNLFDRFSRVAKSNLNNILKTLEDPEKIMSQALEDMQVSRSTKYELEERRLLAVFLLLLTYRRCCSVFRSTRMTWSKFVNPTPK
jgi:hypothetical protein